MRRPTPAHHRLGLAAQAQPTTPLITSKHSFRQRENRFKLLGEGRLLTAYSRQMAPRAMPTIRKEPHPLYDGTDTYDFSAALREARARATRWQNARKETEAMAEADYWKALASGSLYSQTTYGTGRPAKTKPLGRIVSSTPTAEQLRKHAERFGPREGRGDRSRLRHRPERQEHRPEAQAPQAYLPRTPCPGGRAPRPRHDPRGHRGHGSTWPIAG